MSTKKLRKAYRLFVAGGLKEIYMHPINPDSKFCFLKASCTHTMKITATPHQAWIAAEKRVGRLLVHFAHVLEGKIFHVTANT